MYAVYWLNDSPASSQGATFAIFFSVIKAEINPTGTAQKNTKANIAAQTRPVQNFLMEKKTGVKKN